MHRDQTISVCLVDHTSLNAKMELAEFGGHDSLDSTH